MTRKQKQLNNVSEKQEQFVLTGKIDGKPKKLPGGHMLNAGAAALALLALILYCTTGAPVTPLKNCAARVCRAMPPASSQCPMNG